MEDASDLFPSSTWSCDDPPPLPVSRGCGWAVDKEDVPTMRLRKYLSAARLWAGGITSCSLYCVGPKICVSSPSTFRSSSFSAAVMVVVLLPMPKLAYPPGNRELARILVWPAHSYSSSPTMSMLSSSSSSSASSSSALLFPLDCCDDVLWRFSSRFRHFSTCAWISSEVSLLQTGQIFSMDFRFRFFD